MARLAMRQNRSYACGMLLAFGSGAGTSNARECRKTSSLRDDAMTTGTNLLASAAFLLGITVAAPTIAGEADRIRALRAASNAAIAAHDAAALIEFQHANYQLTTGNGAQIKESPAETQAAFERIFARAHDVLYVRTPELVDIGEGARRGYETGFWQGSWTTEDGATDVGGRYAAYWLKTDGEWKLLSELFVTLRCKGPDCD
jgi:ketosteroid isomerase-like protein